LEDALAKLQSEIVDAIDKVAAARSLKDERDRVLVAHLVTLFYIRNPRVRLTTVHESP